MQHSKLRFLSRIHRQLNVGSICRCLVYLAILPSQQHVQAEQHWAFQPIRQPEVPFVKDSGWIRTPIDAFVLAKLDNAGLA